MKWFEIALVVLTLATGIIWLLDRLFFARRRAERAGLLEEKEPVVVDYAKAFFPVLAVVLILRSFVAEPFRIPSSSMMPTLLIGDFILVNKFAYGLRLPISNRKFIEIGAPERGDVVVFRPPHQPDQDWIKRVVGLPGDVVEYRDNTVYVNGEAFDYRPVGDGNYVGKGRGREMTGARLLVEGMPDREHQVLEIPNLPYTDPGQGEWTVPEGQYFVMGDNRDRSDDSRFWGSLPESQLRGKAFLVWMHWDGSAGGVGFDRIGGSIR
ncbi:signal peptidase I [Luteimonas sp. RD2P54]|uniref:Signal peptidase I n=1 Tax=Luteimonas endophytica TaxID=3042023 RepID=A0ABT6J3H4_9GAMM|nr:signal peptidase I [Luteimonas endophytica]MDH5821382.1 signal peptidase I [Luteimonas endophytica]